MAVTSWFGEDAYLQYRERLFYEENPFLYYAYRFISTLIVASLAVLMNIFLHFVFKIFRKLLQPWSNFEQFQFGMDVVFGAYHILATALTAYISERKISSLCESLRHK